MPASPYTEFHVIEILAYSHALQRTSECVRAQRESYQQAEQTIGEILQQAPPGTQLYIRKVFTNRPFQTAQEALSELVPVESRGGLPGISGPLPTSQTDPAG